MDELKRNGTLHLLTSKQTYIKSAIVVLTVLLSSCVPSGSGGSKRSSGASGITNSPSSVAVGYGRILHDNPIILSGNSSLSENVNLSTLLKPTQDFITNSQTLSNTTCTESDRENDICYDVFQDQLVESIQAVNGKWAFDPHSYEFMQVQMYSNMTSMFNKYNTDIQNYQMLVSGTLDTSFRSTTISNRDHWFKSKITGYAHCEDSPDNAFFSPAKKIICLGYDSIYNQVKFVHDPSVLYHELGHALVLAALNVRNKTLSILPIEANLGYFSYDEAKSINEGLADYFSYYMNGRPYLGEWAFGRFIELGRPMTESDSSHAPGISETNEGRLSYPTFLSYNPNSPTKKNEDVHYAGQIISHFLVAFTKDIQNRCSFSNHIARSLTFNIILETLAYLGDLSSTGLGDSVTEGRVNHSEEFSLDWIKANKPITYRRFAQTFSRFVNSTLTSSNICNGIGYSNSYLEELLDSYGLLLFKNYDMGGSSFNATETAASLQKVNPLNRQKTVLIKKNQLFIDNRQNAVEAYVFDGYEDMNGAAASINGGSGETNLSPTIFENSNLKYNNGNSQISPGELVGVLINLYNNSNSEMAGLRILSNDWDHMDGSKPCNNLSDNFPSVSQGGVTATTNPACGIETQDNSTTAPVCFFQDSQANGTVWVSQEEFMNSRAIEATECLGGSQNTKDCLIRSPKGADVAWYSKVEAKKTWNETFTDVNGKVSFKQSNLFFLEISPSVPPGTTVNCRLRATFTNCDDCNNYLKDGTDTTNITGNEYFPHVNSATELTGDEYKDYKYIGADPFVIINYQFTVID